MKLLLTNDDGIHAEGIHILAKHLMTEHEVYISAPANQQSSVGHKVSMFDPLKAQPVNIPDLPDVRAFAVDGTPCDSLKLGLSELFKDIRFDMVVSGINMGQNLGSDLLYSGTASAAQEGSCFFVPAVAMSCCSYKPKHLETAGEVSRWAVRFLADHPLPFGHFLNVNVPDIPREEIKGLKVARLGFEYFNDSYFKETDENGTVRYRIDGHNITDPEKQKETDIYWASHSYITVTPVQYDMTAYKILDNIRELCEGEDVWQS